MTNTRSSTPTRRGAAALIAVAGLLHLILVPEYLAELAWLGVLFALSVPIAGWSAYRLWRHGDQQGWLIGAALAGGMIVGFVVSRTVGLFGYLSSNWIEGVPSLVVEALFLVLAVGAVSVRRAGTAAAGRS